MPNAPVLDKFTRRNVLAGSAVALLVGSAPATGDESLLSALIEVHRKAEAVCYDHTRWDQGDRPVDEENAAFSQACADELETLRAVVGYAPLNLQEARQKMAYIADSKEYPQFDNRELDQLVRSFLAEPGSSVEFRTEYAEGKALIMAARS